MNAVTTQQYSELLVKIKNMACVKTLELNWNIGKEINDVVDKYRSGKYGNGVVKKLAKDLSLEPRFLYRCMQFNKKCHQVTQLEDKNWKWVVNEYLPEPKEEKVMKIDGPFNRTNDNIEWACWTWNPVTGCKHNCNYCYAREIAERFYDKEIGFEPHYYQDRIDRMKYLKPPKNDGIGERNVFTCSMADLFGAWVSDEWIESVLEAVDSHKDWNFLFLTKNPGRYLDFDFPDNAWLGATVDKQFRADLVQEIFPKVKASVKFVSFEPLLERIEFKSMDMLDWIIVGGKSLKGGQQPWQPDWRWVAELVSEAREASAKVYFKPNLIIPKEYPCK